MSDDATMVVRRFLDALFRLDGEAMIAMMSEDIVYEFPFAPDGQPRLIEGRAHVAPLVRAFTDGGFRSLKLIRLDVRAEADPGRVVVEMASEGVVAANGRDYLQEYVSLITVRNGKITRKVEYYNPLPMIAAFG
jgi:uncharacterized protein